MTLQGKHSEVISHRFYEIYRIIAHYARINPKLNIYNKLAINMMKQSPISILQAGLIFGKIKSKKLEYASYTLKKKLVNRLFNLCYPSCFWYDHHLHEAL